MIGLSSRLALSRIKTNRSGLDVLAVLAFAITTMLALTVAGGTNMFYGRWQNPPASLERIIENTGNPYTSATDVASMYLTLAIIACAILVVPILSLGAGAARLGASGRAKRLASLRLLGMTGGEVVVMSVIETIILTLGGALLGGILFLLSLPLWRFISFHDQPLTPGDMVGPWWLNLAVLGVITLLSALSTIIGLRQVVISPLGVAKRETPKALQFWRVIVFVAAIVIFAFAAQSFNAITSDIMTYLFMGGVIMFMLFTVNLVGPWIIQLVARPLVRTSNPATLLAMRRLVSQPRDAWRNVGGLAFIGFISAFTLTVPDAPDDPLFALQVKDIGMGIIITLAIGLLVAATSTLINQAAYAVDRAEQTVALTRMGTPRKVFSGARYRQVLLPLITTLGVSIPLGLLVMRLLIVGTPAETAQTNNIVSLIVVILIGIALSIAAAAATRPIETRILTTDYRRND